jgi:hypothetical protein
MTNYNTINVKQGSDVDEYLQALIHDDGPIEAYSQAGRYAVRQQMQREADNE